MKTSLNYLFEHGLTLLVGILLGLTISFGMSFEYATSFLSTLGTLLAGISSAGAFYFVWLKSNDWLKQITLTKRVDLLTEIVLSLQKSASKASYSLQDQLPQIVEEVKEHCGKADDKHYLDMNIEISEEILDKIKIMTDRNLDIIRNIYFAIRSLENISRRKNDKHLNFFKEEIVKLIEDINAKSLSIKRYDDFREFEVAANSRITNLPILILEAEDILLRKILNHEL